MKHIVIIGGGLGGLTTAALLAKDGYKITLLEQHDIVGGCATVFKRKGGFTCEVGLHEMDGVYSNPNIKKVFEKLDVYNNVEFVKPDEFFKTYTKDGSFVMPDSISKAKTALKEKFPSEYKAIDSYFNLLKNISSCYARLTNLKWYDYLLFPFKFYPILKYKSKSTTEVLDSLTNNSELKLLLNSNVQYYNDSPDSLSFLFHSLAQNSYYKDGGYFIKGGSYNLSAYLAKTITDNGGEVITKANVIEASKEKIIYEYKKENITLYCDKIISNISFQDTYKLFNLEYKENKQIAESITTIYLGFSKNLKDVYGKGSYSNFICDNQNNISFVFVDYSQIDSGLVDTSKSFGAICLTDHIKNWENLDKENYKQKKKNYFKTL